MNLNSKQQFIRFLKDNNVFEKYIYNLEHREEIHPWYPKVSAKKYFDTIDEKNLLYCAFAWSYTRQEMYFWLNLNEKWLDYISNDIL